MSATETTTPPPDLARPVEAPFELANAPEDRPRWGFTLGCAIVVGVTLLVLGAVKRLAPRPEVRAPSLSPAGADVDPFAEIEPFIPERAGPTFLLPPPAKPMSRVTEGTLQVSGRLPPEVVNRILRQNHGRLRACYEAGLRTNPTLQGRITTRFVIGRDGSVAAAANGGSDLPDAGVVMCSVRALYGLSFPQPEGGIVTVSYPVIFRPR
jgi:hypothetical protein